jgi:hypothetical protein
LELKKRMATVMRWLLLEQVFRRERVVVAPDFSAVAGASFSHEWLALLESLLAADAFFATSPEPLPDLLWRVPLLQLKRSERALAFRQRKWRRRNKGSLRWRG